MVLLRQTTSGRIWIGGKDYSLEDLVMEYTEIGTTVHISIFSKVRQTGIDQTPLSDLSVDGSVLTTIEAWLLWWDALDSENVAIASSANQTSGAQKAQNVDVAGITAETIPDVFALTITRPANTTAYTAGDVIGDVSAALGKFVNVSKATGYSVIITNVRLQTNDTGFAGKAMNLNFYNDAVDPIADNAPFVMADANASKRRGSIQVIFGTGAYGKVAQSHFENLIIVPVARDIPIILETAAAATPSANSTWFRIEIGVLLCN